MRSAVNREKKMADNLLYRFRASYQKKDGNVEITSVGIGWSDGETSLEVPFTSLAKHEVSPKNHPRAMLKLTLNSGGSPIILTIREATTERAYSVLSDAKVTISQVLKRTNRKRPAESRATSKKASKEAKREEESVRSPEAIELSRRQALLAADSSLSAAYKDLVGTGALSEDDFWSSEAGRGREAATSAAKGPSNELLADDEPEEIESTKLKYTLNAEKIEYILAMYPAVRRARQANVPPMKEQQFWVKYFQSRYYLRDKGAAVSASRAGELGDGGDDMFARYEQRDDSAKLEHDRLLQLSRVPKEIDITMTAGDRDMIEAEEEPDEDDDAGRGGALEPRAELVVHKINRHAEILVNKLDIHPTTAEENGQQQNPDVVIDDLLKKPEEEVVELHMKSPEKRAVPKRVSKDIEWATIDLSASFAAARSKSEGANRVIDDKSRPSGAFDKPPPEPFRSSAESKFHLAIQLIRYYLRLENDADKQAKIASRLVALRDEIEHMRSDLRDQVDDDAKTAALRAAMLQPITAQISHVLSS